MLHLYETLGWWRGEQLVRQIHFAQESNELHHLLIMEALGGDARWSDRFLARHSAILYFWALCLLYVLSPGLSYGFSELLESHAVDTYGEFVRENKARLRALPAPRVARDYYNGQANSFLRQAMRTSGAARRAERAAESTQAELPMPVRTLYDVFVHICADEAEHVSTMRACQDSSDDLRPLTSAFPAASEYEADYADAAAEMGN
jgi:ubiquinol oxidase